MMQRMDNLSKLLENNRAWAADRVKRDPTFFTRLEKTAGAGVPVDRLLRQPRAGQRDRRPRSRRAVRAPQRRQRRRAHRPQLPVGAAVRGRRAEGEARDRLRPLRLRRHPRRAGARVARPDRQLAAPRAGRRSAITEASCDAIADADSARRSAVRAERDRAGAQRRRAPPSCRTRGGAATRSSCTAGSTASRTASITDLGVTVSAITDIEAEDEMLRSPRPVPPRPGRARPSRWRRSSSAGDSALRRSASTPCDTSRARRSPTSGAARRSASPTSAPAP